MIEIASVDQEGPKASFYDRITASACKIICAVDPATPTRIDLGRDRGF